MLNTLAPHFYCSLRNYFPLHQQIVSNYIHIFAVINPKYFTSKKDDYDL